MEDKNQRLILDGNAFYEIDLNCIRAKEKQEKERREKNQSTNRKRQRD